MAVELEPAAVVDLVAAELVVAAEADLAGDQAAGDLVAVEPAAVAEQAPEQAVAAGVEPALVLLQGQALARGRQPRSVLALALQLVQVRLAVPGLVQVPVHRSAQEPTRPSVLALAVLSVMEAVMDPLTELGTKVPGLKTEPALGLLRNVRQEQIKEQIVDCVTRCSLI